MFRVVKMLITDRWKGCGQGSRSQPQSQFEIFPNIVKIFANLRWQLYCPGVLGPRERVPALPERGQPGQRLLPLHTRQTPGPPSPALAAHRAIIIYLLFIYYVVYVVNIIMIVVNCSCHQICIDIYFSVEMCSAIFPASTSNKWNKTCTFAKVSWDRYKKYIITRQIQYILESWVHDNMIRR